MGKVAKRGFPRLFVGDPERDGSSIVPIRKLSVVRAATPLALSLPLARDLNTGIGEIRINVLDASLSTPMPPHM